MKHSRAERVILISGKAKKKELFDEWQNRPHTCKLDVMNIDEICSADIGPDTFIHTLNANLNVGLYLRHICRRIEWPVFGFTHDLSDPTVFPDLVLAHSAGLLPGDAMFSCSTAAQSVMKHLVSHAMELTGLESSPLSLPVIPYGLDPDEYWKLDRNTTRRSLKWSDDSFVFLFFGRLSRLTKADLGRLIETFVRLPTDLNAVLIIAGELSGYEDKRYVEELRGRVFSLSLQKRVVFVTNPSFETRAQLFSAANAFVSPSNSIQESFGLTILESMLYSLPAIITDWNGYRDSVDHEETGFMIRTWFADGLGEKWKELPVLNDIDRQLRVTEAVEMSHDEMEGYMRLLAGDAELCERIGSNAKNRFSERFTWRSVIGAHEAHWVALLNLAKSRDTSRQQLSPFPEFASTFAGHVSSPT